MTWRTGHPPTKAAFAQETEVPMVRRRRRPRTHRNAARRSTARRSGAARRSNLCVSWVFATMALFVPFMVLPTSSRHFKESHRLYQSTSAG